MRLLSSSGVKPEPEVSVEEIWSEEVARSSVAIRTPDKMSLMAAYPSQSACYPPPAPGPQDFYSHYSTHPHQTTTPQPPRPFHEHPSHVYPASHHPEQAYWMLGSQPPAAPEPLDMGGGHYQANMMDHYKSVQLFDVLPDGTVKVRQVKRKTGSNKKERRRTLSINSAFANLRGCIPNVPSDTKLSKIKTLRLATSYIAYLMDILNKDEPGLDKGGFKAEISKKIESREEKRKREAEVGLTFIAQLFLWQKYLSVYLK